MKCYYLLTKLSSLFIVILISLVVFVRHEGMDVIYVCLDQLLYLSTKTLLNESYTQKCNIHNQ
jgi:hypothetical protein